MIIVYLSMWPLVIFAWREPSRVDAIGDGWRKYRSRLRETARARVCCRLWAQDRMSSVDAQTTVVEADGGIEDFGHVHTITERVQPFDSKLLYDAWIEESKDFSFQKRSFIASLGAGLEHQGSA